LEAKEVNAAKKREREGKKAEKDAEKQERALTKTVKNAMGPKADAKWASHLSASGLNMESSTMSFTELLKQTTSFIRKKELQEDKDYAEPAVDAVESVNKAKNMATKLLASDQSKTIDLTKDAKTSSSSVDKKVEDPKSLEEEIKDLEERYQLSQAKLDSLSMELESKKIAVAQRNSLLPKLQEIALALGISSEQAIALLVDHSKQ
jgi:hypothetical protein